MVFYMKRMANPFSENDHNNESHVFRELVPKLIYELPLPKTREEEHNHRINLQPPHEHAD